MWSLGVVFFCVPITLFWLLVSVKDHHLEVSHHLFDISGEEHMAIQRQNPVWHHRPQGKVGIIKTPDWGLWTLPDCLHPSVATLFRKMDQLGSLLLMCVWVFLQNCLLPLLQRQWRTLCMAIEAKRIWLNPNIFFTVCIYRKINQKEHIFMDEYIKNVQQRALNTFRFTDSKMSYIFISRQDISLGSNDAQFGMHTCLYWTGALSSPCKIWARLILMWRRPQASQLQ